MSDKGRTDFTDIFNENENDNENHKNTFVQAETASLMPRLYAFPCKQARGIFVFIYYKYGGSEKSFVTSQQK